MIMLRNKYKKEKENLIKELVDKDAHTIVMNVVLKGTSKVKAHFIYEVTYLDNGVEKEVPVIAEDMCSAIAKIKPYVNKDISESQAQFYIGGEDTLISRLKGQKN